MRSKTITINNYNDYNKFLKKLFLYKTKFYYNTCFKVENNLKEKNIDYIIEALNIKNRQARITYIYDKSCSLIDEQNKNKNICGFKDGKCLVQQKLKTDKCNGCCRRCMYQSPNGCPTSNLACKLFYCTQIKEKYKVTTYKDLKLLSLLSLKNRLIIKSDYFAKREDVLKDLYTFSLIYVTMRLIYRLIKNYRAVRGVYEYSNKRN